ncbi:arylsulfatase [Arcticibacter svalbardensis]|nr:arylsulfatase [Arcticibacter svalbardensis]
MKSSLRQLMGITLLSCLGVLPLFGFAHANPTIDSLIKKRKSLPNIIFIMADDLGYGDIGFNGQQKIKTPHIDQLAQEGMVMTQHYAGSSVCAPSRASLMTGVNVAHAHVRELSAWTASGKAIDLAAEDVTVAQELKRVGYSTGIIGKWGLEEGAGTGNVLDHGFDYFYGYKTHTEAHHYYPEYIWKNREKLQLPDNESASKKGEYSNDAFTREALAFIQKNSKKPFFLYLPYTIPHNELTVPDESKAPYENLGWPKKPMDVSGHYHHDPEGNTTYAGMISRLDSYIGQLMQELKTQGIDDNTLVIFTSDNGPGSDKGIFNSTGGLRGRKLTLYEGGIREPFAARWPNKIKPGSTSDQPAAFWDLLPTLCDIAGIKPSVKTDGISYLPTLLNQVKNQKKHDLLYWEINESQGPIQAIRLGDWKGINAYQKPFELYNLKVDPKESKNLALSNPGVVAKIKQMMISYRTENPEFPLTKRTPNYGNDGSNPETIKSK